MSLESIKKLILNEAQKQAIKIIDDASLQSKELLDEGSQKAKQQADLLTLENKAKVDSMIIASQAKAQKIIKSAELIALHNALDEAMKQACEKLISEKEYIQKATEFIGQHANSKVTLGMRITQIAEIADKANKLGGFDVSGNEYAITCATTSFVDEFDIKKEIASIADECANELIAKLTNPK